MAFLKVVKGGQQGQIVHLVGDRMVLGRHPRNEIVLDNAAVSRHHAQILQSHGLFYLEDLRSRNNTFVNGAAIDGKTELRDGDDIKICDIQFTFQTKLSPSGSDGDSSGSWKDQLGKPVYITDAGPSESDSDEKSDPLLPLRPTSVDEDANKSSIITTINARTGSGLRLGVKPEVKLEAILAISKALAQTLDIGSVLEKTMTELFKIFLQADEGFILLKEPRTGKMVLSATRTRSSDPDDSVRVSMTIVNKAMEDGKAILSQDASEDSQFDESESIDKFSIRSMMCVPLITHDGEPCGVVQLDTNDIARQFSREDLDVLVSVASQITLAVQNAQMHAEALKQQDLKEGMQLAVQVQLEFLPSTHPKLAGYDFFDFYEAALEVGGDYFDYIELPDGRVAVLLGDVAGKGVPAALLMAKLSVVGRFQMLTKPTIAEAMDGINAEISTRGLGHRFVTMAVIVIDPVKHEVTVANAGHLPPLMRKKNKELIDLGNDVAGTPLGIEPDQKFETAVYPMEPGDIILLHTDGVTDAMNLKNEVYGRSRLKKFVAKAPAKVENFGKKLLIDVERFSTKKAHRDDICVVCVQRVK